MPDLLGVELIEVGRQQVSMGASKSINSKPLSLLLIEANSMQQSQRGWLHADPTYCVTVAFGIREFFLLRVKAIALALLSDSLGQSALRDVAQSVRQQWPMAKILILGRAVPALDDNLYDDEISQSSKQKEIRDMIEKLTPTFPGHGLHAFVPQKMRATD
jgi:hypothetical protein